MDYSRFFKTECKKAGLDFQERVMADLLIQGWRENDAYIAAFGYGVNYTDEYNKEQLQKIVTRQEFKVYIEKERRKLRNRNCNAYDPINEDKQIDKIDLSKVISKEQNLKELYIARQKHPAGSKEWLEINRQIIDVSQMKKDEVKEEDTTIHYYLPLTCHNCSLYTAAKRKPLPPQSSPQE